MLYLIADEDFARDPTWRTLLVSHEAAIELGSGSKSYVLTSDVSRTPVIKIFAHACNEAVFEIKQDGPESTAPIQRKMLFGLYRAFSVLGISRARGSAPYSWTSSVFDAPFNMHPLGFQRDGDQITIQIAKELDQDVVGAVWDALSEGEEELIDRLIASPACPPLPSPELVLHKLDALTQTDDISATRVFLDALITADQQVGDGAISALFKNKGLDS